MTETKAADGASTTAATTKDAKSEPDPIVVEQLDEIEVEDLEDEFTAADQEPALTYWQWVPSNLPKGFYSNPHFGDLVPGRVIEVRERQKHLVVNHDDWKKSSKAKFEDQIPIHEERDRLRQPHKPEEDE